MNTTQQPNMLPGLKAALDADPDNPFLSAHVAALEEQAAQDEADDDYGPDHDYCETCENTGFLNCFCGGDLCVCTRGGEYPCPDCDL